MNSRHNVREVFCYLSEHNACISVVHWYKQVLNFMWLKFFLIWRYFRFWSLVGFLGITFFLIHVDFRVTFGIENVLSTNKSMQINGIAPPENMPRCVNNCHSLESFWKNWHASFNKWLVRYMFFSFSWTLVSVIFAICYCSTGQCLLIFFIRYVYIPLGGSQKKLLNVWVVFTFVAVWHDLEW